MFSLGRCTAALALPVFATLLLGAAPQDDKEKTKLPKDVTVAGCLEKGAEAGTYQIKTDKGTFILSGHKDRLEKNVGKQVNVSGGVSDDKIAGAPVDTFKFRVSAISKLADSCQ